MKNKDVCFRIPEKIHIELKNRLLYDNIYITNFVRYMIEAYIENNEHSRRLIDEYKEEKNLLSKKRRATTLKKINKGKMILKNYEFSSEEIDNIYDILEENIDGYGDL
jgi:hypothetical protein